ncbi:MAG TPA: hypothetical protein VGI35_03715 [Steroidobacteraceae bacterium]
MAPQRRDLPRPERVLALLEATFALGRRAEVRRDGPLFAGVEARR